MENTSFMTNMVCPYCAKKHYSTQGLYRYVIYKKNESIIVYQCTPKIREGLTPHLISPLFPLHIVRGEIEVFSTCTIDGCGVHVNPDYILYNFNGEENKFGQTTVTFNKDREGNYLWFPIQILESLRREWERSLDKKIFF